MKEKLDSESRAAIVNYRLERAYETLKEADYNTCLLYTSPSPRDTR